MPLLYSCAHCSLKRLNFHPGHIRQASDFKPRVHFITPASAEVTSTATEMKSNSDPWLNLFLKGFKDDAIAQYG